METLGEISAAINLIEIKKENLRKSLLDLQSLSISSSNFTLNWTDLDSYFTTLSTSLRHRFNLLHPPSNTISQLKSFCHNSDGLGLRNFIIHARNRHLVLAQLPDAYRCAPDAAAMVLDAMSGFCCDKGPEFRLVKSGCQIMLEVLIRVKPDVTVELKNKATAVAVQWNRERVNSFCKEKKVYALGFLLLVEAYGLIDEFSMDVVIDCIVIIAKRTEAIDLCRKMIPANKINDVIQELINKGMQVAAVKFATEFQKTDEFSPVRLLEERKLMSMRIVEESRKKGKNHQNAVIQKEIITLKSIIKCIIVYGLESECPKDTVVDLVNKLEDDPVCKKRAATVAVGNQKKQKVNNFVEAASVIQPVADDDDVGH